jgi:hypothetical protein
MVGLSPPPADWVSPPPADQPSTKINHFTPNDFKERNPTNHLSEFLFNHRLGSNHQFLID